jgi:hypothetical protein
MRRLQHYFPGLSCKICSLDTDRFNCISWAVEDYQRVWWPDIYYLYYWPPNIPRQVRLDAFIMAFETVGYKKCPDGNYEPGFIKIAIFADDNGIPTHAARQLTTGQWTSKCGVLEDIEHDLIALCGQYYGQINCYMKKPA